MQYSATLNQVTCASIVTAESTISCSVKDGTQNILEITNGFEKSSVKANTEIAILVVGVTNPTESLNSSLASDQFTI